MNLTKETKETIKMYQMSEWEVDSETPTYVLMKKQVDSGLGHLVVLVLTFWTFGIGNLIYHVVSSKKKKVFK